jgi:hypothetical protein
MIFKRNKKKAQRMEPQEIVPMNIRAYPPKINLAWMKSLEGNKEITQWLLENGYKELVMCNQAVYLRKEARDWLMLNGFPHLMAFVHAAEGSAKAADWLSSNQLFELFHMAQAIDNEKESWEWLKTNSSEDIFLLCRSMNTIKNDIEETHNDIHQFGKD